MLTAKDFARITEVCVSIGNEVADTNGFVPIRNLLSRFHARLLIRPLLVEGMLASIDRHDQKDPDANRWAVLVDSETYQIAESAISEESQDCPLPSRFRNTVAHELVHSLAFRPSEFGIRLRQKVDSVESQREVVKAIERETEKLSPLLLWSENSIASLTSRIKRPASVDDLSEICQSAGISRYVLINRLCLLRTYDQRDLLSRDFLRNIAVGIGRWIDSSGAVLKGWPLFVNFDRNIVPNFLLKLFRQDNLPAKLAFADSSFAPCGGPHDTTRYLADAGIAGASSGHKINIECSIENVARKTGMEFLYVVRKQ